MSHLAAFFDSYYRLRPVNATFTGVHEHDDRLPDWSPDGLAAAADEMRGVRDTLVGMRAEYVASGFSRTPPALADVGARDQELAIFVARRL